tara:strand:+ start:240 stop:833 length:594 start_codon:yes stop_codon:yes gene_type:complete
MNITRQVPGTILLDNNNTRKQQKTINSVIEILATRGILREFSIPSIIPLSIVPSQQKKFVHDTIDDSGRVLAFIHDPVVFTNELVKTHFSKKENYSFYTVTKCYDKRYKERTLLVYETRNSTYKPEVVMRRHKMLAMKIAMHFASNGGYSLVSKGLDNFLLYLSKDYKKVIWSDNISGSCKTYVDITGILNFSKDEK